MTYEEIKLKIEEYEEIIESPGNAQERGRSFESLINSYFENEKILIRNSYFSSDNKSEQIDGAIRVDGRIFLVETKWVESNIAASELYAFIGKIDNKLSGTLGLFISKEPLSSNVLKSLTKGRQRKVLILHGEDIKNLFEIKTRFPDFVEKAIDAYSTDNIEHYSIQKYLDDLDVEEKITASERTKPIELNDYLSLVLSKKTVDDSEIYVSTVSLEFPQKKTAFKFYMANLTKYYIRSESTYNIDYTVSNIMGSL